MPAWNDDTRLQVLRAFAANPDVRIERPEEVLYDTLQAAELEEPRAVKAWIDLKLPGHVPFGDRPGGCVLLARITASDQTAARRRSAQCGAS